MPGGTEFARLKKRVTDLKLNTVCQSASCPNIGECWNNKALTVMILGDICTRSCRFCDVTTGRPQAVDEDEPRRVAKILGELDLNHTVITSVDRDDLVDGGARIWAATLNACHEFAPSMSVEVLVPDFKGDLASVDTVLAANPDVFAHNLETVPRLSREVRVQASYKRSFAVLKHARSKGALTKTGIMLGLGETREEVEQVIDQLAELELTILTLGQYLQPTRKHLEITEYVSPGVFDALRDYGLSRGIEHIESGPLVRSSYHAEGQAKLIRRMQTRPGYGQIGAASLVDPPTV